ncbi:saccharopine dehydrogenase NADP-binding domain-containing protein [Kiloniella laminariae]|uniref:Saccharopine dehydrogenase NADP-binding domain-containing protein n=1 Tax=Kiloniella laminariae TaxID=454162 RepID=A0ABT4LEF4_9PROT|nr:saccharopine dehydrogenase C-terminal domain-containing protein [Kiloniella laminariae]MCZ4279484.1 saccharopine dehydrogenase NADP-binding domain-containing protein [Kiloniella laminariae]
MTYPVYGKISGPIVLIGFGSIGRGVLPLIERHFEYDSHMIHVIDPSDEHANFLAQRGVKFHKKSLTEDNYREILDGFFAANTSGDKQGFCVNLSVDTGSLDIMKHCRDLNTLYIDTVVEPWPGFYFNEDASPAERTNYALRETVRAEKRANPGGTTAVSCCGANPGMVSWFVKEALMHIARDTGQECEQPQNREGWASLMQSLGVKGIHIAERDTQYVREPKPIGTFINTWSVEGFISESFQPAELGWGSHEKWMPENAHKHDKGCQAAIYITYPGALTRVHTWCPTPGPQYGFLVTHNEAISISDYYTVGDAATPDYRPTCHYAYHPCDQAVLSVHEIFGSGAQQKVMKILSEDEIVDGVDELGVLLYGHAKNAYWYGSRLSIKEARTLAPFQNATGLQVTSAVLAGMVWALENPEAGIVETDEMDHKRCLEVQRPYLGPVEGHYTDWTPLSTRWDHFNEEIDTSDPWQFRNILAS